MKASGGSGVRRDARALSGPSDGIGVSFTRNGSLTGKFEGYLITRQRGFLQHTTNVECRNPEGFWRLSEIENNRELNQSFRPQTGRTVFLRFLISLLIGP